MKPIGEFDSPRGCQKEGTLKLKTEKERFESNLQALIDRGAIGVSLTVKDGRTGVDILRKEGNVHLEAILKESRKKRVENKKSDYLERQTWFPDGNRNHLCTDCRIVFKKVRLDTDLCPNCGKKLTHIGMFAKVPRKRASNRIWKKFYAKNYWFGDDELKSKMR